MNEQNRRIEFGDFQTPDALAIAVCKRLSNIGLCPDVVIEPTCGRGSFLMAAALSFQNVKEVLGFDINDTYLKDTQCRVKSLPHPERVKIENADFFSTDWNKKLKEIKGSVLVIGNFPWVTNATQGAIGGANLPEKSNFQNHNGFDAITGKANFDISEWMLIEVLRWLSKRGGDVAMLVKTAVARKVLAYAERQRIPMRETSIIGIDARQHFGAAVEACLLIMRIAPECTPHHDYTIFNSLDSCHGRRVGHRMGLTVGDLDAFESSSFLLGKSPQKWRSGVKHDAAGVMELIETSDGVKNNLGEVVNIEPTYLYPLMKGSDIGNGKAWHGRYMLVTQQTVGQPTETIRKYAPKTWEYLENHAEILDRRGSIIYKKNPRFSVFGIGDYAFKPWRIAICGLYKFLRFRLIGPVEGRPVMFDDTVYYLSFDDEKEARITLEHINSKSSIELLSSLIFWDEKRPIKTSILNVIDWSRLSSAQSYFAGTRGATSGRCFS